MIPQAPQTRKPVSVATTEPREAMPSGEAPVRVAYLMSRFPKITETFILYEILEVERNGVRVEVYPLRREHSPVMHPEAAPLVERAHYHPFLSPEVLRAQGHFLARRPRAYLGALWTLARTTFGSPRNFFGGLAFFPKTVLFARWMERDGIQHIHACFCNHPAAAAFVIHRLTGIPFSFTAHGSDLHVDRHMLREKVAEAAFVVPISAYNREIIVDESGEGHRPKLDVIHCGVDTDVFRVRKERPANGRASILCTGTLHEVKGQAYLIEACRLLRDRGVVFQCSFVGDGPDHDALTRQVADAGLQDHVQLLGRRARADVVRLLEAADIVVTPSVLSRDGRREGIPVVLMEAMACGVPVVASRISGIPELVEHEVTGLLAPPRDAEALADAIQRLIEHPEEARRLGCAGRAKVEREFDLAANAGLLAERFRRSVAEIAR